MGIWTPWGVLFQNRSSLFPLTLAGFYFLQIDWSYMRMHFLLLFDSHVCLASPQFLWFLHVFACFGPSNEIMVHQFPFGYWHFLFSGSWTIVCRNSSSAAEVVSRTPNGAPMVVFIDSSPEFEESCRCHVYKLKGWTRSSLWMQVVQTRTCLGL